MIKTLESAPLDALFHFRWTVPLLAELARSDGGKFVTLKHRLGISRDSLQRTLKALVRVGLVMRNPGHGHPLRPEYILTARGAKLARAAAPLLRLLRTIDVEAVGLKKWCMPVVAALANGSQRFSELKATFPSVTARALTLALKDLERSGLIVRRVIESYPPATRYELTPSGRRFNRILRPLGVVVADTGRLS